MIAPRVDMSYFVYPAPASASMPSAPTLPCQPRLRPLLPGLVLASLLLAACSGGSAGNGSSDGALQPTGTPRPIASEAATAPAYGVAKLSNLAALAGPASNSQVVIDDGGNALVIWMDKVSDTSSNSTLRAVRYTVGGGWGTPVNIDATPASLSGIDLAVEPATGRAVASWRSLTGTSPNFVQQIRTADFNPASGTWSAPRSPVGSAGITVSGAVRSLIRADGSVTTVWTDLRQGDGAYSRLYGNERLADADYDAPRIIDEQKPATSRDVSFALAALPEGGTLVAWVRYVDGSDASGAKSLNAAQRPDAGSPWQVTLLDDSPGATGVNLLPSSLAINDRGRGTLVYRHRESDGELNRSSVIVRGFDGGWLAPQVIGSHQQGSVDTDGDSAGQAHVAVNDNATSLVVYGSFRGDGLRQLMASRSPGNAGRLAATASAAAAIDAGDAGDAGDAEADLFNLAASVDGWGRGLAMWSDTLPVNGNDGSATTEDADQIRLRTLDPLTGWSATERIDDALHPIITSPTMATNRHGDTVIVWSGRAPSLAASGLRAWVRSGGS